ncbi:NUDIX hydrolase [Virgibacillus ihumii]|uniref:NUDIX hydrolase n=1 Tax=Virgibacillus ihumii TaxID=2686091 RepID=UPI00157C99D4|nr:NUDIX domain-containing protein [Virgibacillus ihumii]
MELWDMYDKDRRKTGRTHERGVPLAIGDFHLVVSVWIVNDDGDFLISKRHPDKTNPYLWEFPGGSVLTGEDSYQGALREVHEEISIDLSGYEGKVLRSVRRKVNFHDTWLFHASFPIEDVTLQADEVIDARWATPNEIKRLIKGGDFAPSLRYFVDML